MRLAQLFAGLFAISLQRALAYRADMAFQGLMTATGIAAGVAAVGIVFAHVRTLAGWTLGETIVLLGAFIAISGLLQTFVEPNVGFFSTKVKNGELDDLLLQPAPSLFVATLGTSQPWALSQTLLGLLIMTLGLQSAGAALTVAGVLAGFALLLCGAVIAWAFRVLFTVSLAFWAPGLDLTVAFSGFWQMGRYPVSIYSRPVRWILTYIVPVAFVTTIPVNVLAHGPDALLMFESLLVACVSVALVFITWRAGLRRYTGATS